MKEIIKRDSVSEMPVPWDALLPLGIIYGILWVGGEVLDKTHQWQHNWKPQSRTWDNWRELMSQRDIKLTGSEDIQLVQLLF